MAATLQFSRNTKVFLRDKTTPTANIWEIPILDGYSFSQATNATEITLAEMGSTSRRGRNMFNDSFAPAEWSFDTYVRPNNGSAVEEALWAHMAAVAPNYDNTDGTWENAVAKAGAATTINFANSNSSSLAVFDLFFVLGACGQSDQDYDSSTDDVTIYKIEDCVVNSASIDFEIDGIATISWSGFGKIIKEESLFNASTAITTGVRTESNVAITNNYIRNRLTTVTIDGSNALNTDANILDSYTLTLTGGNITIENNITYLTPETLCEVNQPLGHITGARSISGNITCYLDGSVGGSEDFFEDLIGATTQVRNYFNVIVSIGGASAPKLEVKMPTTHFEIPAHSIEDVISLDTAFHALPSTAAGTNELELVYTGS